MIIKLCSLVPRFSCCGALNVNVRKSMLGGDKRQYLVVLKIVTENVMYAYLVLYADSDNVHAVRQLARFKGCLGISP